MPPNNPSKSKRPPNTTLPTNSEPKRKEKSPSKNNNHSYKTPHHDPRPKKPTTAKPDKPNHPLPSTGLKTRLKKAMKALSKPNTRHKNRFIRSLSKSKLSSHEIALIRSILKLGDINARDIMIPRVDAVALDLNPTKKTLQKYLSGAPFSRTPVYQEDIDNLKGIIHIRDIFKIVTNSTTPSKRPDLSKFLSPALFAPESRKIKDILTDLQANRTHMAIIVDEYGGFSGLLTMEDILEEIIGDVQDEFDSEPEMIRQLSNNTYSLDARITLNEFNKTFNLNLHSEDIDTLGGLLIHHQGQIPKIGQNLSINNITFKILSKRRNSLTRIRMDLTIPKKVKLSPSSQNTSL